MILIPISVNHVSEVIYVEYHITHIALVLCHTIVIRLSGIIGMGIHQADGILDLIKYLFIPCWSLL